MTKSELKEMLKQLGARAESVAGEIVEKVEAEKEELDATTRRKVRAFWLPVGFILGVAVTLVAQLAF